VSTPRILTRLLLAGPVFASQTASAQRCGYRNAACATNWDAESYFVSPFFAGTPAYDGRIVFARIKDRGNYECGPEGPWWAHDYPRTESHFMRILKELSTTRPFVGSGAGTGQRSVQAMGELLRVCVDALK